MVFTLLSLKRFAALALCFAAACAQPPLAPMPEPILLNFPQMRGFVAQSPGPPTRSNFQIAADFMDLSFELESGRPLAILTRFEGPITVRTSGDMPPAALRDLRALIGRLRSEAQINISLTTNTQANIVIQTIPTRAMRRVAPNAACFVVPRVQSWEELRAARNSDVLDWGTLQHRETASIFIPTEATPQEMRDCLHEELAQALGPLNDLYSLPDSVFNDDNIHAVLTGFDMLILRTYYAPALRNGMSREEVAARLPALLAQFNPRGQGAGGPLTPRASRLWIALIEEALSDGTSDSSRRQAAARAIEIGQSQGWTGTRAGFAQYAYGRLQIGNDPSQALAAFNAASRAYSQDSDTQIHAAHVALQMAAPALISGDADRAIAITQAAFPIARRHENAGLMSLLMMFQAEALDLRGDADAGMALRLDSLGWALYGFGNRDAVIDQLNEIASLVPQKPPS
ncbi:MAG: hypothetical protein ACJAZ1_002651 [Yoonia sp.]|jgi:hypothetical protein